MKNFCFQQLQVTSGHAIEEAYSSLCVFSL